jgi:hypothetical protein
LVPKVPSLSLRSLNTGLLRRPASSLLAISVPDVWFFGAFSGKVDTGFPSENAIMQDSGYSRANIAAAAKCSDQGVSH